MRVVLLVTNPYRDLPDRLLTALYLCHRGATCYLLPSPLRRREVWPLVPDLVLLDNLRTGNEPQVRRFLSAGIRIAVLDTEQLLLNKARIEHGGHYARHCLVYLIFQPCEVGYINR